MGRFRVALSLAIAGLMLAGYANAQYMFLDIDGDGRLTTADELKREDVSAVSIWVVTDHNRDGSTASVDATSKPLSILSYEFILGASGGTVSWGKYTNSQPTMDVSFGRHESDTEVYLGFGGPVLLPPGKYKLGTLEVSIKSGSPTLSFRTRSDVYPIGYTSFGSRNPGKDGDNTLKFNENQDRMRYKVAEEPGDWADADGVSSVSEGTPIQAAKQPSAATFRVSVGRDGLQTKLKVTTTRVGRLKVRLYDIHGRLVRTMAVEEQASIGDHEFIVDTTNRSDMGRLASGIYLYRVEASEGKRTGRLAIVR